MAEPTENDFEVATRVMDFVYREHESLNDRLYRSDRATLEPSEEYRMVRVDLNNVTSLLFDDRRVAKVAMDAYYEAASLTPPAWDSVSESVKSEWVAVVAAVRGEIND